MTDHTYAELLQLLRDGNLSPCAQRVLAEFVDAALSAYANERDDWLALYEAADAYRTAYFDCGKVMATNAPLVSGGDGSWEAADREYREARVAMYAASERLRPTVEGGGDQPREWTCQRCGSRTSERRCPCEFDPMEGSE